LISYSYKLVRAVKGAFTMHSSFMTKVRRKLVSVLRTFNISTPEQAFEYWGKSWAYNVFPVAIQKVLSYNIEMFNFLTSTLIPHASKVAYVAGHLVQLDTGEVIY